MVAEHGSATETSDEDLLAAHVAGDPEAFGVLFARHRDRLWAVALRTTGDRESAADGLQDGLVAAYRRASSFRGDARVTTWLHRVVVNACLDRLRSEQVRAAEPLPDEPDRTAYAAGRGFLSTRPRGGSTGGDTDGEGDPADRVVAAERRDQVLAALGELPVEQRAALVLVDLEGHPVAEAAVILECAEGTVKSRCARGRAALVARLRPLLAAEPDDAERPSHAPGNRPVAPDVGSVTERGPPRDPPDTTR